MSSKVHLTIVVLCVTIMVGLLSGVGVYIWKYHFDEGDSKAIVNIKTVTVPVPQVDVTIGDLAELKGSNDGLHFRTTRKSSTGLLGKGLDIATSKRCDGPHDELCLEWSDGLRLEVSKKSGISKRSIPADDFKCVTIHWNFTVKGQQKDIPIDCYGLSGFYWFGGFESATQNWPMNSYQKNFTAFVTGDSFQGNYLGSAIDGIFLSSAGMGIVVDETTPLYISVNAGGSNNICLTGKVGNDTPFYNIAEPFLKYDICQSTNIATLWSNVSSTYLPKPASVPSLDVFRYPIWTTWAIYKANINQSIVLKFAEDIKQNNFSISQLEIDDSWTPHYGDFNFTTDRFSDAVSMINNLTDMNIPTTVWMHPFFNNDSNAFRELSEKGFLIKEFDSDKPHLVSWWRGDNNAGVLDFTNPDAVNWYLGKLVYLKQHFNVTSFKFDAGELTWVPGKYKLNNSLVTPNYLTTKYIEMTFQADLDQRRQEVRSGFRNQNSTILLRMLDRLSDWGQYFGVKTLIPCNLVFGMMGYPYVLPDMIGGNAYAEGMPEAELYVRWLQATVFMPVIQFSIPPWFYNSTVVELSQTYLQLHEKYADKIIELAVNAQKTGQPINRPLWWIAPEDETALQLDSEFLLGDDLLVAPVLEKGATSRDIYLPDGKWRDENSKQELQGGIWLKNYNAPLEVLPYFTKLQ